MRMKLGSNGRQYNLTRDHQHGTQEQYNDIIECLGSLSKHIRSDSNKHISTVNRTAIKNSNKSNRSDIAQANPCDAM